MSLSAAPLLEPEVRIRQVSSSAIAIGNGPRQKDEASHYTDIHVHTQPSAPTHHRSASPSPSRSIAPSSSSSSSAHPSGSPYLLLLVFFVVLLLLLLVISRLPRLTSDEWSRLRFPRSQSDVLSLSHTLTRYRQEHFASVVFLFCLLYVFLQSFAIPGPVLLSFLSGPLFGFRFALLLVSLSATAGACSCYWLSFALAQSSVERCFPGLLSSFRQKIESNKDTLLYTLIALRISPLLPNWSDAPHPPPPTQLSLLPHRPHPSPPPSFPLISSLSVPQVHQHLRSSPAHPFPHFCASDAGGLDPCQLHPRQHRPAGGGVDGRGWRRDGDGVEDGRPLSPRLRRPPAHPVGQAAKGRGREELVQERVAAPSVEEERVQGSSGVTVRVSVRCVRSSCVLPFWLCPLTITITLIVGRPVTYSMG